MKPLRRQADRGTFLVPGEERRRSQRVIIRVPVTLTIAQAGQKSTFQAQTVAVNAHGAMLLCNRSFNAETKLEMQNEQTRANMHSRVTRAPRETPEGYLVPVEFSDVAPAYWGISFPPEDWKPVEN